MSFGPQLAQQPGPPPGWNPPFSGKPPPIPTGVNAQQWVNGSWQFNPAYYNYASRPQGPPQQTGAWVVGNGWQSNGAYPHPGNAHAQAAAAAAAAASYNPYKRQTRAPSAEYLATALSDNPLGLTNMVPREELYGEDGTPKTPWIWNPPGLIATDDDDGVITADFRDASGQRIAQEIRGSTPSRQGSHDRPPDPPLSASYDRRHSTPSRQGSQDRTTGSSSIYAPRTDTTSSRPGSFEVSPHQVQSLRRESAPSRQTSIDSLRHYDANTIYSNTSTSPVTSHPLGRPKDPNSFYQRSQPSSSGSTESFNRYSPSRAGDRPHSGSVPQIAPPPPEPESFTSKIELHPTFSTNIIRVPGHNTSSSRRGSVDGPSPFSNSHGGTPPISHLTAHMAHMGIGGSSSNSNPSGQQTLIRHSSLPVSAYSTSSSLSGVSNMSDEPTSALSPLIFGATPKTDYRPIARGYSVPEVGRSSNLSAIPEASPSYGRSSLSRNSSRRTTSTASSPSHRSSSSGSSPNPLPRPPIDKHSPRSLAPPRGMQTPPPGTWTSRRRLGFWNRRGDYLTRTMHVVYAPPDRANPKDLESYPHPTDGYLDHLGIFIPYDPNRLELPESLPRHGQPPTHPYDSFVVYDYR